MNFDINFECCLFCQNENTAVSIPSPIIPDLETLCKYLRIRCPEGKHFRLHTNNSIKSLFLLFIRNVCGESSSDTNLNNINPKLCSDCLEQVNHVAGIYRKLEQILKEFEERADKIRKMILDETNEQGYPVLVKMFKNFVKHGLLDQDLSSLKGNGNSYNVATSFVNAKSHPHYSASTQHGTTIREKRRKNDQLKECIPCSVLLERIPSTQLKALLRKKLEDDPAPAPTTFVITVKKTVPLNFPATDTRQKKSNRLIGYTYSGSSETERERHVKVEINETEYPPYDNETPDWDMDENDDAATIDEPIVKREEDEQSVVSYGGWDSLDTADMTGDGDMEMDLDDDIERRETATCDQTRNHQPKSSNPAKDIKVEETVIEHEFYSCRYCHEKLPTISGYYHHRKQVHPNELDPFLSELTFMNETEESALVDQDVTKWQCNICNEIFISENVYVLIEHMISHEDFAEPLSDGARTAQEEHVLPFRIFACIKCNRSFKKQVNLDLHKLCFHESTMIGLKCDVCGCTKSKTRDELIHHIRNHGGDSDVISCKSCPISCSSLDKIVEHMNIHSWSKRLPCPACKLTFPFIKYFFKHCQEKHSEQKKLKKRKTSCKVVPTGSADEKIICPLCPDKTFKSNTTLENHKKIFHTSEESKRFKCTECGKAFVHNVTLRVHVKQIHLKIRYCCDLCPKSFMSESLLREHKELHSGGGPAVATCSVCQATFSAKLTLKNHMIAVHSHKSGPAACNICDKVCSNIFTLRVHKSYAHSNKNKKKQKPKLSNMTDMKI